MKRRVRASGETFKGNTCIKRPTTGANNFKVIDHILTVNNWKKRKYVDEITDTYINDGKNQ